MPRTWLPCALLLVLATGWAGCEPDSGGWLGAHNRRREHYHAKFGRSYVPLRWSGDLAASSTWYAQWLVARNCGLRHCRTAFSDGSEDCDFGENLAMNWGWGGPRSAEEVLTAWTENEESTEGGHYTQVLWRATEYVGCGSASGPCGHIQVCRYLRPGNCNGRGNYLEDESPCGPRCPAEGCFFADEVTVQSAQTSSPTPAPTMAPPPTTTPAAEPVYGEAEIFEAYSDFDLAYSTLRYDGSGRYEACRSPASQFPVDPTGGTRLVLGDDDKSTINFARGFRFPFFSAQYAAAYVSSNGFVEFVDSDGASHSPALSRHYRSPKVSALFTDLEPHQSGAEVSWKQIGDQTLAITFLDVPTYGQPEGVNSFQLLLHASGDIDITYLAVQGTKRRLVGVSGGHLPPSMRSADLSAHPVCDGDSGESFTTMECLLGSQTFKFEPTAGGEAMRALCLDAADPSVVLGQVRCETDFVITHSDSRITTSCAPESPPS